MHEDLKLDIYKLLCNKDVQKINAFLPIPELTKKDAVDLCQKLGRDAYIGGNFEDVEDFNNYYDGLLNNSQYVKECGFYDNGRIKTWIPYTPNKNHTILLHDITGTR